MDESASTGGGAHERIGTRDGNGIAVDGKLRRIRGVAQDGDETRVAGVAIVPLHKMITEGRYGRNRGDAIVAVNTIAIDSTHGGIVGRNGN